MEMTTATAPKEKWAAPFFTIWIPQAFSLVGSSLAQFALVWWLTQTTGSATVLATASLAAVLPQVLIGPVSGALVDRWNRRVVMIVADTLIAASLVVLAFLYVAGAMRVWHIYVIMAFRALLGGFHWMAMQASTSLMVPRAQLARIAGLNQTLHGIVSIISPPLGAVLLSLLPLHGVIAIDVATALLAITPLFFIAIPQPQRAPMPPTGEPADSAAPPAIQPTVLSDLRAGLRYVWGWPGLFAVLIMATLVNFVVNPAFALMPILVTRHFGGAALELGWLESAWGIGVVSGGLILSVWGGFRKRVVTALLGLAGMGCGTLIVGLAPARAFTVALAGMFLAGFMNPITNGPFFALLQSHVAPEMQGRVFSLVQSAATAMMPLSLLVAGPVADALGVRLWYLVGGSACILISLGAFLVPAIMNIESNNAQALPTTTSG
jgi:DHA3 family macrolide efflux protein-like MFS transporter